MKTPPATARRPKTVSPAKTVKTAVKAAVKASPALAKPDDLQIGGRVKHARLMAGIRMRELAVKVGCTESMISKIESGRVVPSLPMLCTELKRNHFLIGTSLRGNQLSPSAARERGLPRPPAVVLGNEEKGMAPEVAAQCDRLVKIPGLDTVESLNVSAAAAVLCWEFFGKR